MEFFGGEAEANLSACGSGFEDEVLELFEKLQEWERHEAVNIR